MEDLGTLGEVLFTQGVSADGSVVVGESGTPSENGRHAFRWTVGGGMQDLGTLGGGHSKAIAASEDGSVVVGRADTSTNRHAFRWTAAGGMQDLGALDVFSEALAVSQDGSVVVGSSFTNGSFWNRAFRWTAVGGMQNLGTLGGSDSGANNISADGSVVVGSSSITAGTTHAFRWTAGGGMQDIGMPDGPSSQALAVSADGSTVAGAVWTPNHPHAFRWTTGGGMQDLGTLGGLASYGQFISLDGSVVAGFSNNAAGQNRAFRWTASGGMEDLGTLGGSSSGVSGISGDGSVIVGFALNAANQQRAFCWTSEGDMVDLGTLGGSLSAAVGVSADGTIVAGWAHNAANQTRAFRWTPGGSPTISRIDTRDTENELHHHADRYVLSTTPTDQSRTILRRGVKPSPNLGTADFDVVVSECFDPTVHTLSFEADHTFDGASAFIDIPYYQSAVPSGQWGCQFVNVGPPVLGERTVTMRVFIPANAPIGQFSFRAVLKDSGGTRLDDMPFEHPVIVLFNPFDPTDDVYIAGADFRNEYVLNEQGVMWRGTARFNGPKPWNYAQFSEAVLLTTLDLLSTGPGGAPGLTALHRSSVVEVSRWLTEKIDAIDGGVLVGNWSSSYSGGAAPSTWSSSEVIFATYRTTGSSVKYGQCWVYGGLLTSSLRTLGVPTRPLTNFESAHDSSSPFDNLLERCRVFDSAAGRWRWTGEDYWNFHVWCEAGMKRPDLSGRDGWQVVDATPQEKSGGRYQLGPTPVSAILDFSPEPFDGAFVLAEVEADVQLSEQRSGVCVLLGPPDTTWVGRRMTTKAIGSNAAEDITASYKTPETTPDPRGTQEVEIISAYSSPLGSAIHAEVAIHNFDVVQRDYTCYVLIRVLSQRCDELGVVMGPNTTPVTINAGGDAVIPSDVPWALIEPWISLTDFVEFDVVVTRVHDEQRSFKQRVVVIRGLPLSVTLAPDARVGIDSEVMATVSYSNPLTVSLLNAELTISGASALLIDGTEHSETILLDTILPGESGSVTRTLTATIEGQQMFMAHLFAAGVTPGDAFASIAVVDCLADVNGDTLIDFFDLQVFLNWYASGDLQADFIVDGILDFFDVQEFLNLYSAGCP
jgi:probable HAF family extracellular repeat protein